MHHRTCVFVLAVVIRFALPSPVRNPLFNDNLPRTDPTVTSHAHPKEWDNIPEYITGDSAGFATPTTDTHGTTQSFIQANPQVSNTDECLGCDEWESEEKSPQRTNLLILPLAASIIFIFCIIGRCIRWCHEDIELHDEKIEKEELEQADNISRRLSLASRGESPCVEPMLTEALRHTPARATSSRRNSTRSTRSARASISSDVQPAPPPERRFKRPPALGTTGLQRDGSRGRRSSTTGSESLGRSRHASRVGSQTSVASASPAVIETTVTVHDVSSPSSLGYGSGQGSAMEINQTFPGQPGAQQPMKVASASDLNIARALLQLQGLSSGMLARGGLLPGSTDSINSSMSQLTPTGLDNATALDPHLKPNPKFTVTPHKKERQKDYTVRSMSVSGPSGPTKPYKHGSQDDRDTSSIELTFLNQESRSRLQSTQQLEVDCDVFDDASSAYSSYNSTEGQIFLNYLRSNQSLTSLAESEPHRRRTVSVDASKIKQPGDIDPRRPVSRKRGLLSHQCSLDTGVSENASPRRFHVTRLNSSMDSGVGDLSFSQFRFVKEISSQKMKEDETQHIPKQRVSLRRPGRVIKNAGSDRWKTRLAHPAMLEALHPNVVTCKTMKRIFSDPTLDYKRGQIEETHL